MASQRVVASAPGKVLLAGGYLVLDRAYQGLVLGLDARIHVGVNISQEKAGKDARIVVRSPQFREAQWVYKFATLSDSVGVTQTDESESSTTNPFIATTLSYVLTYVSHLPNGKIGPCNIVILADNAYYSHPNPPPKGSFARFDTTISDTHKTGLGSSAALVTALTAALLAAFHPTASHEVVHNLAQASHCAAQGKIGSGFDVAAAVYGTCLYRRFSPAILENLGDAGSAGFGERLHRCVENLDPDCQWDAETLRDEVQLPQEMELMMLDIDCGSSTPGMVRNVLQWRKENPEEAQLLWAALQQGTQDLCDQLKRLKRNQGIKPADHQPVTDVLSTIRSLVREMSAKSGVPIEPPGQSKLIDACSKASGVIGGVVPGAGGYDAIVLLAFPPEKTDGPKDPQGPSLAEILDRWNMDARKETTGTEMRKVSTLSVGLGSGGIKIESAEAYKEWV